MKLLLIPLMFVATFLSAQNQVGINTTNPTGNLEVHDQNHSKLIISSDGYSSDSSAVILRNMTSFNSGTEFILELKREEGLLFRSNSDLTANKKEEILMLKPDGKIGIGTASPLADLHLVSQGSESQLIISPNQALNGDSELYLSESNNGDYGIKLHYDGGLNRLEFIGKTPSTESGPHLTIHRDNGQIIIPNLAGSGNRHILATTSGQLIAGPPSTTTIYAVNSAQFQCGYNHGDAGYRNTGTQARGRHLGQPCVGYTMYAGLQLENGDEINNMTVYFTDDSSDKNLRIKIRRRDHNSISPISVLTLETSGSSASLRSVTASFNNHVVNNDQGSYFLELSCINSSGSLAEWPSTSNPLWLHSVKLK